MESAISEQGEERKEEGFNERKEIIVGIFTPYLFERMEDNYDEKYVNTQIKKYGYDSTNLSGTKQIVTDHHVIKLDTPSLKLSRGPDDVAMIIIGSTEDAEDEVKKYKETGLIVARYSIFYGGPSQYSGNYPEETGYALDLPKDVDTVKTILNSDLFLDAIVAREEARIRDAVSKLNTTLKKPVLITDHLSVALRSRR